LSDDGPTRAIVDLPGGYVGGGPVFGTDDGDVAFWGKVTRVATDACLGGSRPVGPTVRDLANALAHQRHMTHSRPVPVTIGGYRGLYIKTTAPAKLHGCRGSSVFIYTAGGAWLQSDIPQTTFRAWILNVGGQRVVAGTRSFTDTADSDPINRIFATTEFTSVHEPRALDAMDSRCFMNPNHWSVYSKRSTLVCRPTR
jgi:hypothetical protein